MSSIDLTWDADGDIDSYNVYRSDEPMDINNMPIPLAIGVSTKSYSDITVTLGASYYYRVASLIGGDIKYSAEISVDTLNFDNYLQSLNPINYWRMDEVGGTICNDYGSELRNGTYYGTLSYRSAILRKGHAGAMGFAINEPSVSQTIVPISTKLINLTKSSFSWFVWVKPVASTTYDQIFANWIDPSAGTSNMRAIRSQFQFPHNSRGISYNNPLNTTTFIAVIYDVATGTYKSFSNGVWVDGTYASPPTAVNNGSTNLHFPACGSWNYYGMRGYMSDLTFFDKALTTNDIELLYSLGRLQ